jgi:hypothetical protein
MADNIKIVGDILNTTTVSRYSVEDINLISSRNLPENFGGINDYIEYYIYDAGGNLLSTNYNYISYKLPPSTGLTPAVNTLPNTTGNIQTTNVGVDSTLASQTSSLYPIIEIDPVTDLQNSGYSSGEFVVKYNFFNFQLSNYINEALFIKEISPDRTEIRLASTTLTNDEIESVVNSMIDKVNNSTYYVDFLLNFGNNEQYVAINVALNKATTGYEVLFKLYQPLPVSIQEKTTLWIVEEKVNPYVFDINLDKFITPPPAPTLRGPNFDIEILNNGTVSTPYTNYYTLISGLQSLQQTSYHQMLSLLTSQSVEVNVDYTDYNNFVFFGSAYQRLYNFYNKAKEIEDYTTFINVSSSYSSSIPSLITEINKYSSSINNIISQFDGYEHYLYFESSSYAWPKSGSLKPYELKSTGSTEVITWYNNLTGSSQTYDLHNYNNLEYAVPTFLKDDESNLPFLTFLNMVGHYFDNIWIYLKAITDINVANNNLEYGISRDLVYERLKSLGLHLYNSQAGNGVDQFLMGSNTGSSEFPYTPVPGNDFTVTGSYLNNIPRKDLVSELYKRIYHNLPLLLKQKGTVEGLDNLMTVFGIPNRTYYVSGSDTFYTPTGTNSTASILNVKEFGGATKAELIKGYNNDKVRIVQNTIVPGNAAGGYVLSPLHSLQTFPTAAADFRDGDMHYVDISFSPETQIDTYISGAIMSNNPTWSLDDFIGDPRQQYSTTYSDLDTQRQLYYETGVSGYPGFTGSLMDYNGFIRLIQYFDNALFKMLSDFIPERASLSTGVTINSPVLERNKAVYANPTNTTTQSVVTAEYPSSDISAQYGSFYDGLEGNKTPFFTGELSGSEIDTYRYFTKANFNPYLLGDFMPKYMCTTWDFLGNISGGTVTYTSCDGTVITQSLAPAEIVENVWLKDGEPISYTGTISYSVTHPPHYKIGMSALSINQFNHTDFNVLLNNVSKSVASNFRQNIEYIGGDFRPTASILYPAQLQDSYLTLRSYNISRYEGSKTTSLLYNTYSPATGSYGGDNSFGKTAALDHTVRKIGLFTQIESSSYLPKRNTVRLKYLVDEYGNLTELNQLNRNWCDIQRTFIMADTASVSLFDNRKFNNQKSTDGKKIIFDSGYSYSPVLYGTGYDTRLYFDHTGDSPTYVSTANFLSSSYYIHGSSSLGYPIVGGYVTNLYNNVIEGQTEMTGGIGSTAPVFNVPETGLYKGSATLTIMMKNSPGAYGSASFALKLNKDGTPINLLEDIQTFNFIQPAATYASTNATWLFSSLSVGTSINGTPVIANRTYNFTGYPSNYTVNPGQTLYKYSNTFYQSVDTGTCVSTGPITYAYSRNSSISITSHPVSSCASILARTNWSLGVADIPDFNVSSQQTVTKTFTISFGTSIRSGGSAGYTFTAGQKITATLSASYISSGIAAGYTASIIPSDELHPESKFTVSALANSVGNYPFTALSVSTPYFDSQNLSFGLPSSSLAFGQSLSSFYSPGYIFLPTFVSGSTIYTSSLYSRYGDVDYAFQLNTYDIFSAYDISGSYFETRIASIQPASSATNNQVILNFTDEVPLSIRGQLEGLAVNSNKPAQFLFLKRIEDETNTYLKFNKRPGQTSYGFLIPENLSSDVLAKIDTITKEVKQKLISDQSSIIGDLTGGGF